MSDLHPHISVDMELAYNIARVQDTPPTQIPRLLVEVPFQGYWIQNMHGPAYGFKTLAISLFGDPNFDKQNPPPQDQKVIYVGVAPFASIYMMSSFMDPRIEERIWWARLSRLYLNSLGRGGQYFEAARVWIPKATGLIRINQEGVTSQFGAALVAIVTP